MGTYRNDSTTETFRINDVNDVPQNVAPGQTIQTYDIAVPSDFTLISESPSVSKVISGENVFTDTIRAKGTLNVSVEVSADFGGMVELQRSWDDFVSPKMVESFTASKETSIYDIDPVAKYRIGIPTGEYSAGSATVRLSR